ncbi:carbamoyl-phosphate synthase (glutamine-hydrolyzing) cpa2 [Mucor velutinosus]|uniref:Carbamoyl-phosphate synthase (Glutamine-hydrolyzing) cpa2 n=1 Tax=Mucor velutinosus TaxID=708070 RepID=A0AAN7DR49_9FUNG|nr:carbamoyl-phosphate synthase (glutamine-hydrolyzing) cpa2 [Mucor velutinosus]
MQQQPQSPASQPLQRPPLLPGQSQPRPMNFRPQQAPPGAGYRPPMQPGLPRPGFLPPNGSTPPIQPGFPAAGGNVRPGFNPNQQRPMMRPVGQSPMQSPGPRPVVASPGAAAAASPIQQQQQLPQEPPMSPTTQNLPAEHHKRKRMYPEQITKAYSGDVPVSPGYPPQQQQPAYGSSAMASQQVQSQFISPMGTPAATTPYAQPQQQQPAYGQQQPQQLQQPAYNAYGQDPVNQMTSQFGSMSMGAAPPVTPAVPLLGARPQIADIGYNGPSIRLPPNISVTDSPHVNCDTSYQCATINAIPATESLLKKSRLPFALVLAPYRSLKEGDEPVPVVKDSVIARCRRCRTYINPFVTFVEGGQRWKCNMCFLLNDVPAAFDYDNQTQQPADRWKRPELNYGCVEFVAPTEYMVRPPQAPSFVFVIDVSYSAIQSGMLATAARTILDSLDRLPNNENRTRVGIITVDSSLHFYNLNSKLSEPQMLIVSDLDDIYLPQPSDLLANLTESMSTLKTLLEKLPDMFKDSVNVNNALGTALQAAFKLLSPVGGKIICLQSTLPNTGTGSLKPREDVKLLGTSKESTLLNAASPFYKSFAVDCSRSQVACDMIIFGGQYSDVATLSCVPHYTGGQTYYYPGFNASRSEDALKFAHEFSELLAEQIGLEAVIRIRASRGLRMSAFHGNFFIRSSDLLALPNVPRDQNYVVEVAMEDDLKVPTVCFQTALLHTSCTGERRIRVITMCLPVSNSISELYASANQQAITAYLAVKAVERGLSSKLDDARDAIVNKLVDLMGVYKTHVLGSAQGSTPQLTAPDNLKLLPLFALGLIKHDALRQSSQIPTDMRSNAMNMINTMPLQLLIPYLYANLYSLHNMPADAGEFSENGVVFPPALNLTAENLEVHGCYLLENGQNIYLWVGRNVVPQLCADLFDVRSYEGLKGGKITLPTLGTPLNRKVNTLIGKLREMRRGNYYPTLYLVKEDGDPYLRLWFLAHLIEDRTDNIMSYQQFLQHIKDRVSSSSF